MTRTVESRVGGIIERHLDGLYLMSTKIGLTMRF